MKDKEELKLQKMKDKEELKLQKMKDKDNNNNNNNNNNNKAKKTVNVVSGQSEIQIYNPDSNDNNDNDQIVGGIDVNVCQIILKSGTKKGQICGNKAKDNNCCLRHNKINIIL